jgi:hypothetical protein
MPIAVEYPQVFTPHFRVSNLGLILELIDTICMQIYLPSAALICQAPKRITFLILYVNVLGYC